MVYFPFAMIGMMIFLCAIASYKVYDVKTFWASRLAFFGSLSTLVAWVLVFILIIGEETGDYRIAESVPYLVIMGIFFFGGIISLLIGLVSLCGHFQSSCKRLAELKLLITILRQESHPNEM